MATVLILASGCKGNKGDTTISPNLTESNDDVFGGNESSEFGPSLNPNLMSEELIFDTAAGLQTVYFDYNSFDLRPDALSTLRDNADKIKQVPGVIIQVEGHCDERGTQEYNFALAEKRALAVRSHLMNLGVSGDRIITISYGEEDPVDMGHTESAWSKNRRSEFNRAR
jgi:peptidoglycan-associated lipoprotein